MSDTVAALARILDEKFEVQQKAGAESSFDGLGLDSLDVINFLYSVEEELGVKVPDEDLVTHDIETIGALANYIDARNSD